MALDNSPTIWRYENAGTADLLIGGGTTVTNLDSTKSKTGTAFYRNSGGKCFDVPATKEIWIKCDIYTTPDYEDDDRIKIGAFDEYFEMQNGWETSYIITDPCELIIDNGSIITSNSLAGNTKYTFLLHMLSDNTNGIIECSFAGGTTDRYTGEVNYGADFANVYMTMSGSNIYVSNLIISNAAIGIDEDVASTINVDFQVDISRNLANVATISCDTARNLETVWRYENYGTGDLLLTANVETKQVPIEFSKTGYAYVVPKMDSYESSFDIPSASEIWIKFDFSFGSLDTRGEFEIVLGNDDKQLCIDMGALDNWFYWRFYANSQSQVHKVDLRNVFDKATIFTKLHRILIHISENYSEVWIDHFHCSVNDGVYSQWVCLNSNHKPLISNLIISNKPLTLFDEVTSVSYPREITLNIGAYRDITNLPAHIWRYENYGTDELLAFETQTVNDLPATQSKTGSAFIQPIHSNCFNVNPTTEVWLKFDAYCSDQYGSIWVGIFDPIPNQTGSINDYFAGYVNIGWSNTRLGFSTFNLRTNSIESTNTGRSYNYSISVNTLTTYLIHMKIGADGEVNQGLIEFWVNGLKIGSLTGNVASGNIIDKLTLITWSSDEEANEDVLYSNVVISNTHPDYRQVLLDLCRSLYSSVNLSADAVRTLAHKVILSPTENIGDVPDTTSDTTTIQSFEIQIAEQQLTDIVNCITVEPINIMEQVRGQYLDYKYDLRVESLQQRGILYSCTCCSDIDELLYQQIEYSIPPNEQWHWADGSPEITGDPNSVYKKPEDDIPKARASKHVSFIAAVLGKQPIMRFNDFVSTVDVDAGGSTYNDLIRNIFGWTSRIPHKMINCYLRDDKLFVIQRGYEANQLDLTNADIDIVSVDREIVRTIWGSSVWSKTETRSQLVGWKNVYDKDDYKKNYRQQSYDGDSVYEYDNTGLILSTTTIKGDEKVITNYQYETLSNGRKVLAQETVITYAGGKEVDRQIVYHTYLNQGQNHSQVSDSNGSYLGGSVSESSGDDRVTPYSKYTSMVFEGVYKDQERTIYGLTNFDTSFPVYGDGKLQQITYDIKWLNRKTQETITLHLYNYYHVIDFNDRIILNGNSYYLKSNTVLTNNRIVNKQSLLLIRWY